MNKILCALLVFVSVILVAINYSPYKKYSRDSNQTINEGFMGASKIELAGLGAVIFIAFLIVAGILLGLWEGAKGTVKYIARASH